MARGKQKSVMKHDFSTVAAANIQRSKFNLSAGYKTTFDAGYLIPFFIQEYVPGDTHSVTCTAFARLATPIHPIMDNAYLETFFFAVPNRIVWSNWVKLMGEQDDPGDSIDYTVPVLTGPNTRTGQSSLWDYLGLPIPAGGNMDPDDLPVSALPFRAIAKIYNEWFRSEDLQDHWPVSMGDGPDELYFEPRATPASVPYNPFRRGKRFDYFSSCLPFPQKGPGVDLPLGTSAPVTADITDAQLANASQVATPNGANPYRSLNAPGAGGDVDFQGTAWGSAGPGALYADLTGATAASINDLRQAITIQHLLERDARGGTRYQEMVLAHFGVRGGDARLNRPEYLGGGTHPVDVRQVAQTGETATTPQGNLAAYGTVGGQSGFTKSFTEHGYIIGFINARADLTYQKGCDRHWNRSTRYDFYFPAFANLGEQGVLNREIYAQGTPDDNNIFGYQERWAEMRHNNSKITGQFRSDAAASLDAWHLSQDFTALPVLNDSFIEDDPPFDRVIAVPAEPHFLLDAYFHHTAVRPMPVNSNPGINRI